MTLVFGSPPNKALFNNLVTKKINNSASLAVTSAPNSVTKIVIKIFVQIFERNEGRPRYPEVKRNRMVYSSAKLQKSRATS